MGSYRGKGKKGRAGGDYFGSPRLPKRKGKGRGQPSGDKAKKSPVLRHFFFWTVVVSLFMGIFGGFSAQIQSIVLWNDIYTLFGAIPYWDATIGWLITIVFVMCIDIVMVA